MKTETPSPRIQTRTPRSRFGYDRRWWGEAGRDSAPTPYWSRTRRPVACLAFVLPILLTYEVGVSRIGGPSADSLRTGADAWLRHALATIGFRDRLLPPLALVLALLGWQASGRKRDWKVKPSLLLGMAIESVALGAALIGLSRLVDLGFNVLESGRLLDVGGRHPAASILGYLGAGIFEEAIFRLALIPAIYWGCRLLQAPKLLAGTFAITGSSLLFSIAHHAGSPGEPFTLFAFIFRWLAGIAFAWVFVVRGYGIAVGTHAAYDILVGSLDWG